MAETLQSEALCESPDRLRIVPIEGADVRQLVKVADCETVLWALVERAVLT